jgi:RNA polymerase sigma-70 factor (ECF subfamily)
MMPSSRLPAEVQRSNGPPSPRRAASANEAELFKRLGQRDVTAMAELYALYSGPIYSFALRTLGSREDAEEVLQDTFVRLWEKAADYNATLSRPFTWTFLLARGICLDRLRRAGRRARTQSVVAAGSLTEALGAACGSGLSVVLQDELRHVLLALEGLPAPERRAVEMAVFLEYTGQEIADQLHEPLGTIKSRIRRGLKRLRQLLKCHDRS